MNQDGNNVVMGSNEDHSRFFADIFAFFIQFISFFKNAFKGFGE